MNSPRNRFLFPNTILLIGLVVSVGLSSEASIWLLSRLKGLLRRTALRPRIQQAPLDSTAPDQPLVTEVVVENGAPCAGKQLKDIPWPQDCLIANLHRGQRTLVPNGATEIRPGDLLVIVAAGEARQKVLEMCKCPP